MPFKQAVKLPIWFTYNSKISIKGKIILQSTQIHFAMIRIGFHKVPICNPNDKTILNITNNGVMIFNGTAHIGNGSKIHIFKNAQLTVGDNFAISASSQINCYNKIVFGRDIQFSWDCLTMDSDTHSIFDENGNLMNKSREIVVGDKVWIGCRATILKGAIIPSNTVIGACSLVSGRNYESNSIIVGNPAKLIKKISKWEL